LSESHFLSWVITFSFALEPAKGGFTRGYAGDMPTTRGVWQLFLPNFRAGLLIACMSGSPIACLSGAENVLAQTSPPQPPSPPVSSVPPVPPQPNALRERPQNPKRPFPYVEQEVVIANVVQHVMLAGTLTKPKGPGPFPVVLVITGSGPQDRDETLLLDPPPYHKPFLIISDYLTRRGIEVLRLDDRGTAGSTGDFFTATTADFATDIEAGVEFLSKRADVDRKHIGLVGHAKEELLRRWSLFRTLASHSRCYWLLPAFLEISSLSNRSSTA
jgi:hypothetical protein